jgi:hypothetical protein
MARFTYPFAHFAPGMMNVFKPFKNFEFFNSWVSLIRHDQLIQFYDHELQRHHCKNLHTAQLVAWRVFRIKHFLLWYKNIIAYYNDGVVAVNSKVVGLAPQEGVGQKKILAQSFSPFWHEMGNKFVALVGSGRQV